MTIRVFLVEEQPVLCLGIRTILDRARDIQVVGELYHAQDVEAQMIAKQSDVVILAQTLSKFSSLSIAKSIGQLEQPLHILAYGRVTSDPHVKAMLAAGAMGYALTTDAPNSLIDAVRAVAAGQIWLSPNIIEQTFTRIDHELGSAITLTAREEQVLQLIGEGKQNSEIAETLDLQTQTVKNYIYRIYQKLGVDSRSQAMLRAIRLGLVHVNLGDQI